MIQNHHDIQYGRADDHPPVVRLFCANATWLLSDVDAFYDDIAFGLCDLGLGSPELGYVSISDLENSEHPILHIPVERDIYFEASYPMSVYAEAARMCQHITDDPKRLEMADQSLKQRENKL